MFATSASDAGAQSISPTTTQRSTAITTGKVAPSSSARYGDAISNTPVASFALRGTPDVQRVTLIWSATITIGFMAKSRPQVAGARPYVCVSETGASSSNAA